MAMERPTYRINLEALMDAFPEDPFPAFHHVAKYLHKDPAILKRDKTLMGLVVECGGRRHITLENLAWWLSGRKQ